MSPRFALFTVLHACIALFLGGAANMAEDTPAVPVRTISVTTTFPGASASEVESAVTLPLEHVLQKVPGIEAVTSTSRKGESIVSLRLSPEQDLDQAKKAVAKAVQRVTSKLPAGAEPPIITTIARTLLAYTHGVLLAERRNDRPAVRVFLAGDAAAQELSSLPVPAGSSLVPLDDLADISVVAGVDKLQRRNGFPMVRVTAGLPVDRDSAPGGPAVRLAEKVSRELQLPDEYFAKDR